MAFEIKPNINRYIPTPLVTGWAILDLKTGEILKRDEKHRIERYLAKRWAQERCDQLNQQKDSEK